MSFTIDDIRGHIPLLRKLTVILESGSHMDYATPPITAFLDAPQIRDVTLVAISLRWISLPWAQLTHLNLRELSTAQCAKILQVTPRLESLSVIVRGSPSDEPFPLVRLDHLHTFKSPYMADLRLLDYIVGPALKHLDIPMLVGEGISHLLAFLVRSGCRLSSISLAHFTHSQAISALEVVATVNEIFLHFINWPRAELASFFTRIATDSHFLPNLETLSLEEPSSILPYVELCEMLESRWHGRNHEAARLKSFRIRRVLYRTLELKPAISRRLQALVDDGLRIDI
ncbi:hypothetical protein DFH09DRAFT_275129 [Mycena vulgaris]|nr:hypothetical protein DFH09DRAFT_275129 [Mycena vulgaris]